MQFDWQCTQCFIWDSNWIYLSCPALLILTFQLIYWIWKKAQIFFCRFDCNLKRSGWERCRGNNFAMKYDGHFDSVQVEKHIQKTPFAELEMATAEKYTLEVSARKQNQRQTVDSLPFRKLVKCILVLIFLSLSSLCIVSLCTFSVPLWLFP